MSEHEQEDDLTPAEDLRLKYAELRRKLDAINELVIDAEAFAREHGLVMGNERYSTSLHTTVEHDEIPSDATAGWEPSDADERWIGSASC